MISAATSGALTSNALNTVVLPPARNGYRRSLYAGRAVSVYFDQHPSNEWQVHTHVQDQVSGIVGEGSVKLRYLAAGGGWMRREFGPSMWWVVPRDMPHAVECADGTDMVTLFVETSFTDDMLGQQPVDFAMTSLARLASQDQLIAQHAASFRRLCWGQIPANDLYIESVGTVMGAHILRSLFLNEKPPNFHAGLSDEALARVVAYIEVNYPNTTNLEHLAGIAGYSSGHFGVLFKRSMGLTPHDYLMRHRLSKAWDLLGTTNRKEIDIAHACGFSDDTHLARHVRNVLQCLPRQLRGTGLSGYNPAFPRFQPIPPRPT